MVVAEKYLGLKVEHREVYFDEVKDFAECGLCGTAAVISPVGELRYKDDVVTVNNFEIGELTQKLYDTLTGIQWGRIPDKYGWTVEVK